MKDKDKYYDQQTINGIVTCSISMKGTREDMQDYVSIYNGNYLNLGVFDGHAGIAASQYLSQNLLKKLDAGFIPNLNCEQHFINTYIQFDKELKTMEVSDGTTAVTALVTEKIIYVANVGDSVAIKSDKGFAYKITEDHNINNSKEVDRAKNKFVVMNDGVHDTRGVKLKVFRAFGDFTFKDESLDPSDQAVSPVPEVFTISINENLDCLIIYSDGLSEFFKPQEVISFLYSYISSKKSIKIALEILFDYCYDRMCNTLNGCDNMSLGLVFFCGSSEHQIIEYVVNLYESNQMKKWEEKKSELENSTDTDCNDFLDCQLGDV